MLLRVKVKIFLKASILCLIFLFCQFQILSKTIPYSQVKIK